MVETPSLQKTLSIWEQVVNQETAYSMSRQTFLAQCENRVEVLRQALRKPSERTTALQLYQYLTKEEKRELFEDLVELASVGHSDIDLVRKCILSLSRLWLEPRIEKVVEPILQEGTEEEYRRFLELYRSIDRKMVERLAKRAIEHPDPDIQEAGEDFMEYLNRSKTKNWSKKMALLIRGMKFKESDRSAPSRSSFPTSHLSGIIPPFSNAKKNTSKAEVTNISSHGIWILSKDEEMFLSYENFPWFKEASISNILHIEEPYPDHFYWPDLEIDLSKEIIKNPERFPLKSEKSPDNMQ